MGFVTDTIQNVGNMLTGKGPAGLDPNRVNAAAFTDPNREANKNLLEQQRQQYLNQSTQAGQQNQQTRLAQQNLIQAMQGRVAGTSPSVAELQLMKTTDQNRQAIASQAASMPSGQAGLAQRNVLRTQGQVGQQAVQDAALLRSQEQQAAEQSLAGVLGQTRTLDQAEQQQANTLALQYMQMGLSLDQAQFLANQELEKVKTGQATAQAQVGAQQQGSLIGAAGSGLAAFLLSDEKKKRSVKSSDKDVSKFLKSISSKSFEYKDGSEPGAAPGRRYGVMAQDLEKSPMGKSLVMDTPNGKVIDSNQAVGALLSAVSSLNKRMEKVGA